MGGAKVEFGKVTTTDKYGNIISESCDFKMEDGKVSGKAVDNLKEEMKQEIIEEIEEEIIKPENAKIKRELEEIKSAITKKDGGLLKKSLKKLLEKGAEKGLEIIMKLILAQVGG